MINLKELYNNNVNIMQYLRDFAHIKENSSPIILASYDMQSGSYVRNFEKDETNTYWYKTKKIVLKNSEYRKIRLDFLAEKFKKFIPLNDNAIILEAGTGESTTLILLTQALSQNFQYMGFDISLSRVQVGRSFCGKNNFYPKLFCADMLNIPLADNSVDVVFTSHAIEPNTNKELEILTELTRVSSQYLILIEPSYELGNEETKQNIEKHCYIKNLKQAVHTLNLEILFHDLMPASTFSNMSEIFILKKTLPHVKNTPEYACPQCRQKLLLHNGNYFCSECGMVYPILNDIPDLNINHGILFSQYLND